MIKKFFLSFSFTFPSQSIGFLVIVLFSSSTIATSTDLEFKDLSSLPRIALIIGNSNYKHGVLKNAEHDAKDIAKTLLNLGFSKDNIMLGLDLNKKHTRHMLREFSERLKKSSSVGLFFYAGHGAQYQNEDYIIPINANITTEDEINDEAIRVEDILEKMEDQGENRLNIVILDACRNNPFPRSFKRSLGSSGLAGIEAPVGSIIAYATGKGMVASDGSEKNGLYTKHLLANMQRPGLSLAEIFIRTRSGVMKESKYQQRPWEQTAVTGSFYFLPSKKYSNQVDSLITAPLETVIASTEAITVRTKTINTQANWIDPTTDMEFVLITPKPSCFIMGSPADESGRDFDEKQHRVCLENHYWMGKYEVTQAQWLKFTMSTNRQNLNPSNNSSFFYETDTFPVENISWNDAQQFIDYLNAQGNAKYRLPTEAEWEYAARAGTSTPFYTGNCITSSQANLLSEHDYNYCGSDVSNLPENTTAVGSFAPNPFGLYDMAGNVWEWTCSSYDKNYTGKEEKCASSNENNYRVIRGGSWSYSTKYLRSAVRFRYNLNWKDSGVGFRLVRIE